MSLYNDGYSARAVALAMGMVNDQAKAVFTQTSTNNLLATDTIQIGNSTFTIVAAIGSTPGNVLKGPNWLATMTNVNDALAASIAGTGATANYIPLATPADTYGEFNGATVVDFFALTPGAAGSGYPSVYTASGTAGGSFGAATFVSASPGSSRAVDWTVAEGLSLQFEVTAAIVEDAVFEVWGDTRSASNSCNASGVSGNQARLVDSDLCNPLTGAGSPMVVTIPATQTVVATNIQGFSQTTNISPVGAFYQGRPRCFEGLPFVFIKPISGDTANINVTALLSRLKVAN
jgi:hypothetical protein